MTAHGKKRIDMTAEKKYTSPSMTVLDEASEGVYMASGNGTATITNIGPIVFRDTWNDGTIGNFSLEVDFAGVTASPAYLTIVFSEQPNGLYSNNGGVTDLGGQTYRLELWNCPTSVTIGGQASPQIAVTSAVLS
jgi:hypothetical protein